MNGLLILLAVTLVSGCAVLSPPPPPPTNALAKGSKVGLVVTLDSEIEHLHVGTTAFNNFSYSAKLPWDMTVRTKEYFTNSLSAVGYQVLDLKAIGFDEKTLGALVIQKDKEWVFYPEMQQVLNRLRNEFGIDAVVNVSTSRTRVRNECSNFGCSETYMDKSGLFTRGMFLSTQYYAVPALYVSAYRLNEPSSLSVYDPLRATLASKVKILKDFSDPVDLRRLSDTEFIPVADSIAATINALSAATATVLSGSAKMP